MGQRTIELRGSGRVPFCWCKGVGLIFWMHSIRPLFGDLTLPTSPPLWWSGPPKLKVSSLRRQGSIPPVLMAVALVVMGPCFRRGDKREMRRGVANPAEAGLAAETWMNPMRPLFICQAMPTPPAQPPGYGNLAGGWAGGVGRLSLRIWMNPMRPWFWTCVVPFFRRHPGLDPGSIHKRDPEIFGDDGPRISDASSTMLLLVRGDGRCMTDDQTPKSPSIPPLGSGPAGAIR